VFVFLTVGHANVKTDGQVFTRDEDNS